MRLTAFLIALALFPSSARADDEAPRRFLQEVCAAGGTQAILAIVEAYTRNETLQPNEIAESLGAADAQAERGYCEWAAAAADAPQTAFAAFKAASGQGHDLDVAFARGRLFAKPPRRAGGSSGARFDGSLLVLGGPGLSLVPQ